VRISPVALLGVLGLVCLPASRCASPFPGSASGSFTIVAYNVKSLFDDKDDGVEFPEFSVAKGKWDSARYKLRLESAAAAVFAASPAGARPRGPDLLCLEEIENGRVLEALRSGPLSPGRYAYSVAAPAEGGPFSVCALSRAPIVSARCHAAFTPSGRAGRDILELELDAGKTRLFVLACHWKSKLGGGEATEEARRETAALVRSRVEALTASDPAARIVVCGDLNEAPDEFLRSGKRYPTALMPLSPRPPAGAPGLRPSRILVTSAADSLASAPGEPVLFSPWESSGGYSFSFRGSRERIDNFLLSPGLLGERGLRYGSFSAAAVAPLVDAEGDPVVWPGSGASGFSDHLPILLVLRRGE